jgi:DNA-binding SARP family transcriptional activator/pimeloyl-ACP methyl ester carboxylesterase
VEFAILGPLEVSAGGQLLSLPGARLRAVLAMLLAAAGQVVAAERLTEELWPGQPADRAAGSLQVRVSQLRKILRLAGEPGRLVTQSPGYLLRVEPGELDAARFGRLADAGRAALEAGDAELAARRLDRALSLWRGPVLADLADLPFAQAEAARLDEERVAALEAHAEARLACGRHAELVAELEMLTATYPLRERLWAQRMLALYRAGRQADALQAYRELRALLVSELGIEPGPEVRELEGRILRQDARIAPPPAWTPPETQYARSDDGVHLAYQVLGTGKPDIIAVPGLLSHLDLWWEDQVTARFFRRLARLGRLIMFDKRDTGLSDRGADEDTVEQRVGDLRAVMRACGSDRAVLFGYSEGAPMSILFTARYPRQVRGLILAAGSARWTAAPGYPCGEATEQMASALEDLAAHRWGRGHSIEWYAPSLARSEPARRAMARWERMGASPSAVLRMLRMIGAIDVRDLLPRITVPVLIIQRREDRITPPVHGRYLASALPDARYFEQPGDHLLWVGDTGAMFGEIQEFLASLAGS